MKIEIWRKAPSKAKHPICTLSPYYRWDGVRDGWRAWFGPVFGNRRTEYWTDDAVRGLVSRHRAGGSRITVTKLTIG